MKCCDGILFDTDAGIDDIFALLFLICGNFVNIRAISTVFGNFSVEEATDNILNVLRLFSPELKIKVYQGCKKSRRGYYNSCKRHHGNISVADFIFPETGLADYGQEDFSSLDTVLKNDICTVLACGPLTNISEILYYDTKIKEIFISGGLLNEQNADCICNDFNIKADPEAANIVFKTDRIIKLFPVSVTEQFVINNDDIDQISFCDSIISNLIKTLLRFALDSAKIRFGISGCFLHDVVPALIIKNPQLGRFDYKKLNVISSDLNEGRLEVGDDGVRVACCKEIDVNVCKRIFLDSLNEIIYDTRKCN